MQFSQEMFICVKKCRELVICYCVVAVVSERHEGRLRELLEGCGGGAPSSVGGGVTGVDV